MNCSTLLFVKCRLCQMLVGWNVITPPSLVNLHSLCVRRWVVPLVNKAYRQRGRLEPEDIFHARKEDSAKDLGDRMQRSWREVTIRVMKWLNFKWVFRHLQRSHRILRAQLDEAKLSLLSPAVISAFWKELATVGAMHFINVCVLRSIWKYNQI